MKREHLTGSRLYRVINAMPHHLSRGEYQQKIKRITQEALDKFTPSRITGDERTTREIPNDKCQMSNKF